MIKTEASRLFPISYNLKTSVYNLKILSRANSLIANNTKKRHIGN